MPIVVDQKALSSEIVSKLTDTNSVPYCYLSGQQFNSFTSLENSSDVYKNAFLKPNQTLKQKVFKSSFLTQENFANYTDIGDGTPKVLFNLGNESGVPVASFDDLSTFAVNAFIEQTNVRNSRFILLKDAGNGYKARYSVDTYALLTKKAIESDNLPVSPFPGYYVNNQNSFSRVTINSREMFWNALDSEHRQKISNLKPVYNEAKNAGWLDAARVNNMITAVNDCAKYISRTLSCLFCEFDLNAKCTIVYHPDIEEHPTAENYSVTAEYYSPYRILTYDEAFPSISDDTITEWTLELEGDPVERYNPGNTIYPDMPTLHLYPVTGVTIKYITIPISAETRSATEIKNFDRPEYVRTKVRKDDNLVVEKIKKNTENFELPSCKNYFKAAHGINNLEFIGWGVGANSVSVDYKENGTNLINTGLTITSADRNLTFKAIYALWEDPPPDNPYEDDNVDIRMVNNRYGDSYQGSKKENQKQSFNIKVPLNGKDNHNTISYSQGDLHYSNKQTTAFRFKDQSFNPNFIKKIKVNVKVVGNTQHKGNFTIESYINDSRTRKVGSYDFTAAETKHYYDDFGNSKSPWAFSYKSNGSRNFGEYNFTFNFDSIESAINLDTCYFKIYGKTGYSTNTNHYDDAETKTYPYRCRFYLKITEVLMGHLCT